MPNFAHRTRTAAPPGAVFSLYKDVASWPAWDADTLAVSLPGLTVGATGWLKPRKGPKVRLEVVEVTQDRSFTVQAALPFCRMRFGHDLRAAAGETTIEHSVRFDGPLAFVFRRLIGRDIDRSLPETLAALKAASEEVAGP